MHNEEARRYMDEAARRGLSVRAAAKAAGMDPGTLCRLLKGTYAGDAAEMGARCLRALDALAGPAVIPTGVVAGCRAVCAAAYAGREVAMVWGPTQCGKTTALEQCCRENPGYRYFRFPDRPRVPLLAETAARALGVWRDGMAFRDARRRIVDAARGTLLIADEVHEAFLCDMETAAHALEFLREVFDRSGCGVVLCGTETMPLNFRSGRFAPVLRQTLERGLVRKAFPGQPAWRDVERAALHFGVPSGLADADKARWQARLRGMSFGAVCRLFRSAAHMAGKRGRPMGWERVTEALATLDQFAAPE